MTAQQDELSFPSAPIEGETEATVELVGRDWRADEDWRRFEQVVRGVAAMHGGEVDPNRVRGGLSLMRGDLTINPRRLSAFYHRAAGKNGFLEFSHWGTNQDHKGRNAGKPARIYKLRSP